MANIGRSREVRDINISPVNSDNSKIETARSDSPRARIAQLQELQREIQRQIQEEMKQLQEREPQSAERAKQLVGKEKDRTESQSREDVCSDSDEEGAQIYEEVNPVHSKKASHCQAIFAERSFVIGVGQEGMEPIMKRLVELYDMNFASYEEPVRNDVTHIHNFFRESAAKRGETYVPASRNYLVGYKLSLTGNHFIESLHTHIIGVMAHAMLAPKYDVQYQNIFVSDSYTEREKRICALCETTIRVICREAKELFSHQFPDMFGDTEGSYRHNQEAIERFMLYVWASLPSSSSQMV